MPETPANPLHDLHQQAEAEFQAYGDVEIVSTYGQPQAEYAAIHKGCAIFDLPQRGILEVTGKDRLEFLNRFLTNELIKKETRRPLAAGQGVYAFLLNNKGRIVADMNVLERGDRTLLESDARNIATLQATLQKFLFSDQVAFVSRLGISHQIAFYGPKAIDVLRRLAAEFPKLSALDSAATTLMETEAIVWRDDPCGVPGYFLILPSSAAVKVWTSLVATTSSPAGVQPGKREAWPVGWAAFNSTRIEAGRAMFGIDFDDSVLPAETGLSCRAVSFTKGCYLGQEIVARMESRGQAARQIVGIKMNGDFLPIAPAPILDPHKNSIGAVTSSTISPVLSNSAICLAMVKKTFTPPGTVLQIAAEGDFRAGTVVELPFLKAADTDTET